MKTKQPTHFVEIVGNDFDKEQWVNNPAPIQNLNEYLEASKTLGLKTIAVFKITPKQ
ncbi:MAG: hypothetical protein NVSMB66_7580 [Candidatus Doudnabacteria bacterium]